MRPVRFRKHVKKQKFIADVVYKLKDAVVGLGDFSQKPNCPIRQKRGPVNQIRKHLIGAGVRVISINEYCTSKKCCECGRTLDKIETEFFHQLQPTKNTEATGNKKRSKSTRLFKCAKCSKSKFYFQILLFNSIYYCY